MSNPSQANALDDEAATWTLLGHLAGDADVRFPGGFGGGGQRDPGAGGVTAPNTLSQFRSLTYDTVTDWLLVMQRRQAGCSAAASTSRRRTSSQRMPKSTGALTELSAFCLLCSHLYVINMPCQVQHSVCPPSRHWLTAKWTMTSLQAIAFEVCSRAAHVVAWLEALAGQELDDSWQSSIPAGPGMIEISLHYLATGQREWWRGWRRWRGRRWMMRRR